MPRHGEVETGLGKVGADVIDELLQVISRPPAARRRRVAAGLHVMASMPPHPVRGALDAALDSDRATNGSRMRLAME